MRGFFPEFEYLTPLIISPIFSSAASLLVSERCLIPEIPGTLHVIIAHGYAPV